MSRLATLLTLLTLSFGLSACTEEDACAGISTCGACTSEYVAKACKWCPSDSICTSYADGSSCAYSELKDDPDECGGTSSTCTRPYSGPVADPQSSAFCQAAYHYDCQGDSGKRNDNCRVYAGLQTDNPGMPSCPYCP